MSVRIGYLVPEFPGQTHAFFWRELAALRTMGIEADIVSTRRPGRAVVCHEWSAQAERATTYLFPPSVGGLLRGGVGWLAAGPRAWVACLGAIRRASGVSTSGKLRMLALMMAGASLAGLGRVRRWTHIHAHSAGDAALLAMFASMIAGIPYSLTLHGYLAGYGPAQNIKWEHAAFGTVVAAHLKKDLARDVPGLDLARTDVAPMGVDPVAFSRRSEYRPPLRDEPVRIVSCGRLDAGKGHGDLIDAVSSLTARGIDARLTILGEGPEREALERAKGPLGDRVKLPGATAEGDVRAALESAHIFALASRDEAIGVATMEAMSMGLPVIATRVGGVPDLVRDGVDGILVEPASPGSIVDAVRRLIDERGLAERLGRSGAERIRRSFTSRVSATALARRLGVREEPAAAGALAGSV